MQCPIDKVDLVMADRNGIEIDYCPKCRGVWLDRGERDYRGEREYRDRPHHKKRKSFLDDIFDF